MVRVHHKFVVVDAEGGDPVVFTGSANFSGNSLHENDENLLEITRCPRLAGIYFAEFRRLYEHYRARATFAKRASGDSKAFVVTPDNTWTERYFGDTPESRARVAMVSKRQNASGDAEHAKKQVLMGARSCARRFRPTCGSIQMPDAAWIR